MIYNKGITKGFSKMRLTKMRVKNEIQKNALQKCFTQMIHENDSQNKTHKNY